MASAAAADEPAAKRPAERGTPLSALLAVLTGEQPALWPTAAVVTHADGSREREEPVSVSADETTGGTSDGDDDDVLFAALTGEQPALRPTATVVTHTDGRREREDPVSVPADETTAGGATGGDGDDHAALFAALTGEQPALRPTATVVTHADGRREREEPVSASADETTAGGATGGDGDVVPPAARSTHRMAPRARGGWVYDEREGYRDLALGQPIPGLFVGSVDAANDRELLREHGITHVLNVAKDLESKFADDQTLTYLSLPLYDDYEEEIRQRFDGTNAFIEGCLSGGGAVLVHCMAGISRSATIVAAYVMKKKGLGVDEAVSLIRETRWVQPNTSFKRQLQEYRDELDGKKCTTM